MSEKLNEAAAQAARERFEKWKTANSELIRRYGDEQLCWEAFQAGMRLIEESRQPEPTE